MSLTEEAVADILGSFSAEWDLRVSKKQVGAWHGRLKGAGMNEGNYEELFRQFRDSYPLEKRKPGLAEFARFVWKQTARDRAAGRQASGPPRERCYFCDDTGYVPMAVPLKADLSGYDPAAQGFKPPALWTATPAYRCAVPCRCSGGQRAMTSALSTQWLDARKRAEDAFPAGAGLPAYLRDCHQARARIHAQSAPGGRQGDETGASHALTPQETENGPGGDFRGITGKRRGAVAAETLGIPEDELPF